MKTKRSAVVKLLSLGAVLALAGGALALLPRTAAPQASALAVFAAPSHVPLGQSWVLLGSRLEDLPGDLAVEPNALGVKVVQVQKLSSRAVAALLQVDLAAAGKLLRVSSAKAASEATADVYFGQAVPPLAQETNFTADDFVQGSLIVGGDAFLYAWVPATETPLGALRIHNRATGVWHSHEMALEKARGANAPPAPLDPAFVEVDPLKSPADTDGDGVPDFAELAEPKEPTADQLGVVVKEGQNTLDVVAVDERGNASWKLIEVFSTQVPAEGGF